MYRNMTHFYPVKSQKIDFLHVQHKFSTTKLDDTGKSRKTPSLVILAEDGIQRYQIFSNSSGAGSHHGPAFGTHIKPSGGGGASDIFLSCPIRLNWTGPCLPGRYGCYETGSSDIRILGFTSGWSLQPLVGFPSKGTPSFFITICVIKNSPGQMVIGFYLDT